MTTLLRILLLVIGSTSALSAFSGKTSKDGPEPFIERITARGWISLVCLVFALFIGTFKELYSSADDRRKEAEASRNTAQEKHEAETRQTELKGELKTAQDKIVLTNTQLELANTKLELATNELKTIKEESKRTQDQITGGSGFPVVDIMALQPDTDASFPLWVIPHGDAPMFDVSYNVMEGAFKPPTPEELEKMMADAKALVTGHGGDSMKHIGTLEPHIIVPLGDARIRPSQSSVNTYRILLRARNGSVLETMDVRFNQSVHIWQFRYEIRSQDPNTPNKLLVKEDWQPKQYLPPLYGVGPPHNKR